jgi:hypothetical protein
MLQREGIVWTQVQCVSKIQTSCCYARLKLSIVLRCAGVGRLLVGSESRTALAVTLLMARSFSFSPSLPLHKGIDFKQVFDV